MFKSKFLSLFVLLGAISYVGCSSSPIKVTEFSSASDPDIELNRIADNIKQAQLRQEDVLSPTNFQFASEFLNQAKESRNQNLSKELVLHKIAISKAYIDKANNVTISVYKLYPYAITQRQNALNVNAIELFPIEFNDADKAFKIETKKIENDESSDAEKNQAQLAKNYSYLELISIKKVKDRINKINDNITESQVNLKSVSDENNKLKFDAMLDAKYENARNQFSQDEAEIYKQGNKLLIRLRGLSFATSQSTLSSKNYALLNKVQDVIKDFGSANILIEGHTDSTGSKETNLNLSTKRAKSVEAYFIANKVVDIDKIKAEGFADNKPLTSNKNAKNRADNRRVDVIITPNNLLR